VLFHGVPYNKSFALVSARNMKLLILKSSEDEE
jgi:hypothetical protein